MKRTITLLLTAMLAAVTVADSVPSGMQTPSFSPSTPATPAERNPASDPSGASPTTNEASPELESVLVREVPLEYAAWVLSVVWGRHLVVDAKAKNIQVRLFLRDSDCLSALKALCHAYGLWYREDPESRVIYIETVEEFLRGSAISDKKFVDAVSVIYARAEDLAESIRDVFKDMVVYTAPEEENGDNSDLVDRALIRMDQLSDRSTFVKNGAKGTHSNARRDRDEDGLHDVNKYYDDMKRVAEKTKQIIADAKGKPIEKIPGVVFMSVSRETNTILMRSSDREMLHQVRGVIQTLDRPKAQVLLEVKVLSMDVTDEKQRQVDFLMNSSNNDVGGGFSDGLAEIPAENRIGPLGIAGSAPLNRSFVFQLLDKTYQIRLKLLNEQRKVRRLATPSLLVADFEASRIFVGQEKTILMNVENSLNVTGTESPVVTSVSNAQTERRDIGTTLVITPKIHADNTVTIRIMQENARVGDVTPIEYDKSKENKKSFDTTDIVKQTISSTVVAKSGETLALGGLINTSKTERVASVPILSKIPVIGPLLFERRLWEDRSEELVVLIRPYVILTPDVAEYMSQQYLVGTDMNPDTLSTALNQGREVLVRRHMTEMLNHSIDPMETPFD